MTQFYGPTNNISVVLIKNDYELLCAMEPYLRLKKISPLGAFEPGTYFEPESDLSEHKICTWVLPTLPLL